MAERYSIEFVNEGVTIEAGADESILEAAEEAGMELPYQCRMGICGVCSALREDGDEVEQNQGMFLSEAEKEEGYVLTCIARPLSDLRLQSGESP